MKTIIDSLIGQFAAIAHPAGGWFKLTTAERKRHTNKIIPALNYSPDCFAIRGGSSKKTSTRRTPAP